MDIKKNKLVINCDVGEHYGNLKTGMDSAIFPYIDECNIACGYHAGDPLTIEQTIQSAKKHGVRIGAHPSYPDMLGFGRYKMDIPLDMLKAVIKYQVSALKGMVESYNLKLNHVKAHGALYHKILNCNKTARIFVEAISEIDKNLMILSMPSLILYQEAKERNICIINEAFIDRRYNEQGKLLSRKIKNAIITNPDAAVEQLQKTYVDKILDVNGKIVQFNAQSFCIHGDNPMVIEILKKVNNLFR